MTNLYGEHKGLDPLCQVWGDAASPALEQVEARFEPKLHLCLSSSPILLCFPPIFTFFFWELCLNNSPAQESMSGVYFQGT